jgi:glycosyltransferase involved in cell wall biosynthesis
MKLSIITPSINRSTLRRTVESIQCQTYDDWQYIIMLDGIKGEVALPYSRNMTIINTPKTYNNYGNSLRHLAWEYVEGDYIMYIDDDDYYSNPNAFADIAKELELLSPLVAFFPGTKGGKRFFSKDPGLSRTMSNQFIHKKYDHSGKAIIWPDTAIDNQDYGLDGEFIQSLIDAYDWVNLEIPPAVEVPHSNYGKFI